MFYLKVPLTFLSDTPGTDGVNRFRPRVIQLLQAAAMNNHVESWATAWSDLSTSMAIVDDEGNAIMTAAEALSASDHNATKASGECS